MTLGPQNISSETVQPCHYDQTHIPLQQTYGVQQVNQQTINGNHPENHNQCIPQQYYVQPTDPNYTLQSQMAPQNAQEKVLQIPTQATYGTQYVPANTVANLQHQQQTQQPVQTYGQPVSPQNPGYQQ